VEGGPDQKRRSRPEASVPIRSIGMHKSQMHAAQVQKAQGRKGWGGGEWQVGSKDPPWEAFFSAAGLQLIGPRRQRQNHGRSPDKSHRDAKGADDKLKRVDFLRRR
jgi:hypothetical protein